MEFEIAKVGFETSDVGDDGNRFLIGNGYAGVRGTLEEDRKDRLTGTILAGIYDQVGEGWREPLNAPNGFYTCLYHGEMKLAVGENLEEALGVKDQDVNDQDAKDQGGYTQMVHEQRLDFRYGIRHRKTTFRLPEGQEVHVTARRFASMKDPHLFGMTYIVESQEPLSLHLVAGIDGDVWDIHGPHYAQVMFSREKDSINSTAYVQNSNEKVCVTRKNSLMIEGQQQTLTALPDCKIAATEELMAACEYTLNLQPGERAILRSFVAIYTTKDSPRPAKEAYDKVASLKFEDYERLLLESMASWEWIWERSQVTIEGDEEAEKAVNYSLYHLNCAAPRHREGLSIPARALSAQTYKGAIFWDTEMFMLDYFLYSQPEVAKSLIKFRVDTLKGAMAKAKSYGFKGAFYAWESQEGGVDACSDYNVVDVFTERPVRTYFKDKQVHISSAVAYGIMQVFKATGDKQLLLDGGAKTVLECARFYTSLLIKRYGKETYELHDVIGPDEYHERVNNNAYTNRMAKVTLEAAVEVAGQVKAMGEEAYARLRQEVVDLDHLLAEIQRLIPKILQKLPGATTSVIEQHDGYFMLEDRLPEEIKTRLKHSKEYWGGGHGIASDTQVIKQADVIAMLALCHEYYDQEVLKKNFTYYEPRTEHGSSLSACMYGMVACLMDEPDLAYPFFMKSATAEIRGGGKQWAGLVYIGGTHPAAAGGAWKNLVQGFLGLSLTAEPLTLTPRLPKHVVSIKVPFVKYGRLYEAVATHETWAITPIEGIDGNNQE